MKKEAGTIVNQLTDARILIFEAGRRMRELRDNKRCDRLLAVWQDLGVIRDEICSVSSPDEG